MRHFLDINLNGISWTQELKGSLLLGRCAGCDIVINCPYVSRYHATLVEMQNDKGIKYYRIMDGHRSTPSTSGLIVNGQKTEIADLLDGDRIEFVPSIAIAVYQIRKDLADLDTQTWNLEKEKASV